MSENRPETVRTDGKRFDVGMYGGKFLPFHLGHRYCVETAAKECRTVHVILFCNGSDEERILRERPEEWLSAEERIERMKFICREASKDAEVIPSVIDCSSLRLPDGEEDWDAETPLVREIVGNVLNAVYSSEESYGEYFGRAYPEAVHRLVDVERIRYPISGTMIRGMKEEGERRKWMV